MRDTAVYPKNLWAADSAAVGQGLPQVRNTGGTDVSERKTYHGVSCCHTHPKTSFKTHSGAHPVHRFQRLTSNGSIETAPGSVRLAIHQALSAGALPIEI
jgi:hypothetical protein